MNAAHPIIRSLLLGAFAFFIVYLARTDALDLYIAANMQLLVKLAALGLYAIAGQQLFAALRSLQGDRSRADACCDDHGHDYPSTWRAGLLLYGWFSFPLLLAVAIPGGMLGSAMAAAKGVQYSPQQVVMPESPADSFLLEFARFGERLNRERPIRVSDERFIETLTTLDLYRSAFLGRTVQLSGFVFRERGMDNRHFSVTRFAVSCCSADAYPYGVLVAAEHANAFEANDWVEVTGRLTVVRHEGKEVIGIDADSVRPIPVPDDPYVSPDLNFGPS